MYLFPWISIQIKDLQILFSAQNIILSLMNLNIGLKIMKRKMESNAAKSF